MADEQLAQRLERERYQAMLNQDLSALESLLSDSLMYAHSNGEIDTKASYLEMIRDGRLQYLRIEHDETAVTRSAGTMAVLGRMQAKVLLRGKNTLIDNYHLIVWAEEARRWTVLAHFPARAA